MKYGHLFGSVPFAHVAIDHSQSQQPVPRGFPLFKCCEWLVVNCNVDKRASLIYFENKLNFCWELRIVIWKLQFNQNEDDEDYLRLLISHFAIRNSLKPISD